MATFNSELSTFLVKTHWYFDLRKHGVSIEQVEEALRHEVEREVQPNQRIRIWGYLPEIGKCLRIILLPDGETVLNVFPDSRFTKMWREK